jgi:hypothetical protein
MPHASWRALLLGCLTVAVAGIAGAQSPPVRAVVLAGDAAPGGGTFERFSIESLPIVASVNSGGQVAFFATLLRAPASEGLFLAGPSAITKIAAEGDSAPGGGTLSGFGRHPVPAINDAGDVAFAAAVAGGKTVEGVFVSARRRLRAVAVAGGAAPGVSSGTLAALDAPAINSRGDVAFLATVRRGRENVEAIYVRTGERLTKVVAQGDAAPAGGAFGGFGPPALNDTGAVAFAAVVEGRSVPGGVFVASREGVRMLVGAGEEAPTGGIFAKFSERLALNDAGTVAFTAVLKNAPTDAGIFVAGEGRPRKVVVLGDAAPGGGTFSHFGLWPVLSAAGAVGFAASVDGGASPVGMFVTKGATTTKVAAIGDTLAGRGKIASFGLYPVVTMNRAGGVTFATAPTATGEGAEGIFLVPRP